MKKRFRFNGAKAENVTFAYKDEIILDNLSADIPKIQLLGSWAEAVAVNPLFLNYLCDFGRWRMEASNFPILI